MEWIAPNSRPLDQRVPEKPMLVAVVVENRTDVLRSPSISCPPFAHFCSVMTREGVGPSKPSTFGTLRGKGIDHVAHDGIADSVTHEDDCEFSEELGDKPCGPPLGKVCLSEIRRCKDQISTIAASHNLTM